MPVSNEERNRLADKEIEMYDPNRIDPKNNLRSHPNWNMRDLAAAVQGELDRVSQTWCSTSTASLSP
jgi:hypothetical protein